MVATALTEGEREQIKLRAAYLNGLAIGLFLVGGLSIPTTIVLSPVWDLLPLLPAGFSLFCILSSPALHLTAQRSLKALDR